MERSCDGELRWGADLGRSDRTLVGVPPSRHDVLVPERGVQPDGTRLITGTMMNCTRVERRRNRGDSAGQQACNASRHDLNQLFRLRYRPLAHHETTPPSVLVRVQSCCGLAMRRFFSLVASGPRADYQQAATFSLESSVSDRCANRHGWGIPCRLCRPGIAILDAFEGTCMTRAPAYHPAPPAHSVTLGG